MAKARKTPSGTVRAKSGVKRPKTKRPSLNVTPPPSKPTAKTPLLVEPSGPSLRPQADALLQETKRDIAAMPVKDVQQLVHELQVHQVELEIQNDELRRAQIELEVARDRYADLYDFSPAGHLSLDLSGRIMEANLRAGALLGVNRRELIGKQLVWFVASDDQAVFHRHRQEIMKTGTRQTCEVRLRNEAGAYCLSLESLAVHEEPERITHWRMALLDISSRKRAEQEKTRLVADLARSREHFKSLFDWTPSAVGISTMPEGRFCDVNEGLSRLTGYTREELIGRTTLELGLWADPSQRAIVLQEIQEQGHVHNREGLLRTKSGEIRALMVSVEPIQLGSTPCLIYLGHDITERKRAEEALRLAKFSMDRAADAVYWIDPQAKILDANEAASLMLGYSKDELCAMTVHDLNPDFQANIWPGFWAETRKRTTMVIETSHKAKNGRLIPIEASVNFLSYEGKEYHCAFVRDITERKRTEAEFRESEARFRNLADTAPAMLWVTEPDGSCSFLSRGWYEFTGQTEQEELGKDGFGWLDSVHPEDRERAGRMFLDANKARRPFSLDYRLLRHDGEYRWTIDAGRPRFGPNGEFLGYTGSVLDITERKQAEVLLAAEKKILELIATGTELAEVLDTLMRETEAQSTDGILGSVLLADEKGQRLLHGAAPSLPEAYNEAVHGLVIGPSAGSCGTAAFERKPVFVTDIAADPRWVDFKDMAAAHGLGACHSTPILSSQGRLLGTIAMYYRRAHNPGAHDRQLIERATQLAGIAIERRQGEAARARLAAIVEGSDDAIFGNDLDDIITSWNQGAQRLFGYTEQEVIGRPLSILFPPDRKDEELSILDQIKQDEVIQHYETVRRRKDGSLIEISIAVSPIKDSQGRIIGASRIARDITERKQAEEALKHSEERFGSFVRSTIDGIVMLDRRGLIIFWNPGAEKLFGYAQDEVLGKPMTLLMPERFRERHERGIERASAAGHLTVAGSMFELVGLRKDGTEFPNELSLSFWSTRNEVFFTGIVRDITERKIVEEALQASDAFTRDVLDSVSTHICVLDWEGVILKTNDVWEEFAREHPNSVFILGKVGDNFFDRCRRTITGDASTSRAILNGMEAVLAGNRPSFHSEYMVLSQEKVWWFLMRVTHLKESRGIVMSHTDISERVLMGLSLKQQAVLLGEKQKELESLAGKLIEAQEEERKRVARDLHDDFNQRLAAIWVELESMEQASAALPEPVVGQLAAIRVQIGDLSDDLHDMAYRLHPSLLEHVGLDVALRDYIAEFTKRTGLPVTFNTRQASGTFSNEVSTNLFRVMQESLQNVSKHAQATNVVVRLSGSSKGIGLSVSDNGKGFDLERKNGCAHGLGLVSMQERARGLGGFLRVHSLPRTGTKVRVWIPHA